MEMVDPVLYLVLVRVSGSVVENGHWSGDDEICYEMAICYCDDAVWNQMIWIWSDTIEVMTCALWIVVVFS